MLACPELNSRIELYTSDVGATDSILPATDSVLPATKPMFSIKKTTNQGVKPSIFAVYQLQR
jgi:hypothetical protein